MKKTKISWTHHTFNPWMGCTKVSAGCANCYAETLSSRWHGIQWGKGKPRTRTSEAAWAQPLKWNKKIEKSGGPNERVFSLSMGDVFDSEVEGQWRDDLFDLVRITPRLDWLLLTKRPQLGVKYAEKIEWPDNAWIGTSIESQATAFRANIIKAIPAPVRFLSMEPLLEPVTVDLTGIDWVIVGGESGPGWRSMQKAWVLDIKRQCDEAKVPFFFKQWAGLNPNRLGHKLNGAVHHAYPTPVNRKPVDQVREAA